MRTLILQKYKSDPQANIILYLQLKQKSHTLTVDVLENIDVPTYWFEASVLSISCDRIQIRELRHQKLVSQTDSIVAISRHILEQTGGRVKSAAVRQKSNHQQRFQLP